MTAIPALTVWQPWASLIAEECKTFEFRSWPAPKYVVGRRIAIHASARPVRVTEVRAFLIKLHSARWRETGIISEDARARAIRLLEKLADTPNILPMSSVLCTAMLGQPLANAALAEQLGVPWVNDSDRDQHANWGWPLSDIERLQPLCRRAGSRDSGIGSQTI